MEMTTLGDREDAELARGASEAAHIDVSSLIADEREISRYLAPPADTPFPLEYAHHLLGAITGKDVLDYGCGDGLNTVVLARRGAKVIALDLSPDLLAIAQKRVERNVPNASVLYTRASAHDTQLPDSCVDLVLGIAILHHLDLEQSAREVFRLLKPGGRAIFKEPVRNSRLLRGLRSLVPYRQPDVSPFEKPLTDSQLDLFARAGGFTERRSRVFVLPITRLIEYVPRLPRAWVHGAYRLDGAVLARLKPLGSFAGIKVVELEKPLG